MTNLFFRIINLIIGLIIISYIIYTRLILVRAPKSLSFFDPLNYSLILIAIMWISISIFIIFKSMLLIFHIKQKYSLIERIAIPLYSIIINALCSVFQFIANQKENSDEIILSLAKQFYAYFGEIKELLFFAIISACKLIILSAFLVDVFISLN